MIVYSNEELSFIKEKGAEAKPLKLIASLCNEKFHNGRAIRTYKGIEFAFHSKLKLSHKRFKKKCEVCNHDFYTSWPQARYCSSICHAVIEREYEKTHYRLNRARLLLSSSKKQRERFERRWKIILNRFGNKCAKCGLTYPRVVYDLHHINGKKSRRDSPSQIIRAAKEEIFQKMLLEVELLCANCHRLLHFETQNWGPAILQLKVKN